MLKKRLWGGITVAACAALVLAACGGSSSGGDEKAPIKIGSVNALSGSGTFAEASEAAEAFFDRLNEEGGINGHQVEYKILDDKGDPGTASSAARELVGSDEVVALVGGASQIECEINAKYYEQEDVLSIPGIGVDGACFTTPNIAPANVGPFNDMTLTLLYGSEVLNLDNICVLLEIAGSTRPHYQAAIDRWTEATGKEPIYIDDTLPYGASDYTPYLIKAKNAGCEAVSINPVEPDAIAQVKGANSIGWDDITWLYLTSVYSENFAESVDDVGEGLYVPAEFFPFTEVNDETQDWRELMEENDIGLTAFSQGGYLAAKFFTEVVSGIEGEITRDSVNEALRSMKPIEDPMLGTPYEFGPGDTHHNLTAGWPIKLNTDEHKWELAEDDWLLIP